MRFLTVCAAALVLSMGCGASMTTPSTESPLRVTVAATPTFAGSQDTATFTLRVENLGPVTADLTFPSSCQVLPYFLDRRTGQPVTPRGGGFACLTVITHLTLRTGESYSRVITVKSGDAPQSDNIVLPAGDYAIYARLEDSVYRVKSEELAFSVR
jgi:hypothetical protein